jgi:hypothetical protein
MIEELPEVERTDPYLSYRLQKGKNSVELEQLEVETGLRIPKELKEFYEFSYGALLNEYEMLTMPGIASLLPELRATYEAAWKKSILPFAYVRGVGDVVAFDLNQTNETGGLLILDGFHELPPADWEGICYGLKTWLFKMVENHFRPFWLGRR